MEPLDRDKTLAKIIEFQSVAQTYLSKAAVLLAEYQEAVAPVPLNEQRSTTANIRSLQLWTDWLAENGPAYRQTIWDATGLNLSKGGYDRTQAWRGPMTYMPDDALPADAVLHIQSPNNGKGRPPMIYFLWSSRWDVLPKFGVGPVKPDNLPESADGEVEATDVFYGIPEFRYDPEVLQEAVIQPPTDRYATMVEWDDAWMSTFDSMVAAESKPPDELKQQMRDSLPDGAEPNAAIAIAHRNAVARSRSPQPMLGVIQPPVESPHALSDGPWEEPPLDWDTVEPEPDRSGWEMVGNHNHIPHPHTALCDVSRCQRIDGPPPT